LTEIIVKVNALNIKKSCTPRDVKAAKDSSGGDSPSIEGPTWTATTPSMAIPRKLSIKSKRSSLVAGLGMKPPSFRAASTVWLVEVILFMSGRAATIACP
jgi:hypothetical protein